MNNHTLQKMTREEAREAVREAYDYGDPEYANEIIKALEQEPKTGHWIVEVWNNKEHHICSVCQKVVDYEPCYHYCPYCGAKLKEEREDKGMYIACKKCKYNHNGECDFYYMGSGNEIDMPCYREKELIKKAAESEIEESINFLKGYLDEEVYSEKCRNAHRMAIKALELEPCCNCIEFKRYAKEMGFEIEQESILDKTRAEIERERSFQRAIDEYDIATGLRKALEIIDKYKAESEVEG